MVVEDDSKKGIQADKPSQQESQATRMTRSKGKRAHDAKIDYSLFDEDYDCLSEQEERKKRKAHVIHM